MTDFENLAHCYGESSYKNGLQSTQVGSSGLTFVSPY